MITALNPWIGSCHYYRREGDREIAVVPLTFGRARIITGPFMSATWEHGW